MRSLLNQIHGLLVKNKMTVSVAESCTGGLLSALFTQLSGSSQYFVLGIVAYSNSAKENILGIPPEVIAKKGAVSKEVASLLAKSSRRLGRSDFGIGVTGIAGPTGAAFQKPVGTVFISIYGKNRNLCERFLFSGNRAAIRKKTAIRTLELLKSFL